MWSNVGLYNILIYAIEDLVSHRSETSILSNLAISECSLMFDQVNNQTLIGRSIKFNK